MDHSCYLCSAVFQCNFNDVLETLRRSQPFFVRCLKVHVLVHCTSYHMCVCVCVCVCAHVFVHGVHFPQSNSSQATGYFDPKVVSAQIQTLAIFETVDYVQGGKTLVTTPSPYMVCNHTHLLIWPGASHVLFYCPAPHVRVHSHPAPRGIC